jgi:hypothetical protein
MVAPRFLTEQGAILVDSTMPKTAACGLANLAFLLCTVAPALAEDFRIQTRVFHEDDETPISQNLTLFRGGLVYDYLSEPAETTIFDRPRGEKPGRFVLLDTSRKVQTEVTLDRLERFTSNLLLWAAAQSDPFLRFLAQPEFKEEFDAKEQAWTYSSRWMDYRIKAEHQSDPAIFPQFDTFSESFVRLNTMLTIRNRPPYGLGRLGVNTALRARREIPTHVHLVVESPNRFLRRKSTYRSEHQLTTLLSQSDQARIRETQTQLVNFKRIDLEEYLQPDETK